MNDDGNCSPLEPFGFSFVSWQFATAILLRADALLALGKISEYFSRISSAPLRRKVSVLRSPRSSPPSRSFHGLKRERERDGIGHRGLELFCAVPAAPESIKFQFSIRDSSLDSSSRRHLHPPISLSASSFWPPSAAEFTRSGRKARSGVRYRCIGRKRGRGRRASRHESRDRCIGAFPALRSFLHRTRSYRRSRAPCPLPRFSPPPSPLRESQVYVCTRCTLNGGTDRHGSCRFRP